ncbi:MAG: heme NO-binding domain-containing protein [Burkholderiales bacterium]
MYGLVNKAIEDMVTQLKGGAAWEALKRDAGVDLDTFVGMDQYDDAVTYRLVAAASRMLNLPSDEILEAFGEYWTMYTAEKGYGHLMNAAGENVFDVLDSLDDMHTRLEMLYPNMRIPHFDLTRESGTRAVLRYESERDGLAPMVVGLVKGLGKRFDTPLIVERLDRREDGAESDSFRITLTD